MKRRIVLVGVHLFFLFLAIFIAFCDFNNADYYKYIYNIGNVIGIFRLSLFQLAAICDLFLGLIEFVVFMCYTLAAIMGFIKKQLNSFYLKGMMFYGSVVLVAIVTLWMFVSHGTFVA